MENQKQVSAWFLALLTTLAALGQLSVDLYLPSLPDFASDFSTEPGRAQLTLSAFLLGFSLANVIVGPLADAFGRRPVLLTGLTLYVASGLAMSLAANVELIIAMRFLQAMGACAASVVTRAIVRDTYGAQGAGKAMSYLTAGGTVALAIGPVIGGVIAEFAGWRGNFGFLAVYGLVALALAMLFLPETNPVRGSGRISIAEIFRSYGTLIRNRVFLGNVLTATSAYAGIFCFISASSFVLIEVMGLQPRLYGACFAVLAVGFIAGATMGGKLNNAIGPHRLIQIGSVIAIVSGSFLVASVQWMPGLIGIVGSMFFYELAVGLILGNAIGCALAPFPKSAGAASSLLGLIQTGASGIIGAALGHLGALSAMPMAVAILASGTGAALAHVLIARPKAQTS